MRETQGPRTKSTAAALLLGLFCAPALASSGFSTMCEKLHLETVDLATSSTIDPTSRIDSESTDAADTQPAIIALTPNAETILREIFDETIPEGQVANDPAPVTSPKAAPIAELTAPAVQEQRRDIEAKEEADADRDVQSIDTRVPGLSDDELLRYRRQMYRTDI